MINDHNKVYVTKVYVTCCSRPASDRVHALGRSGPARGHRGRSLPVLPDILRPTHLLDGLGSVSRLVHSTWSCNIIEFSGYSGSWPTVIKGYHGYRAGIVRYRGYRAGIMRYSANFLCYHGYTIGQALCVAMVTL
jgi:hypothetical protein